MLTNVQMEFGSVDEYSAKNQHFLCETTGGVNGVVKRNTPVQA